MNKPVLTRVVWMLSLVSLFNDIASEMLYPVMPVYLRSIGFSVFFIGILEGLAEAIAGISKGYFGSLSDRLGKRMPFVRIGYLLSAAAKPMLALSAVPLWIFGSRTLDRLGKGVRTAARDALLSDESTPETKGAVFGFHRSLDTVGAVVGPAVALTILYFLPGQYRLLFLIAFIPGILSVLLLFTFRERQHTGNPAKKAYRFTVFLEYWKTAPVSYRKLVGCLLLFALFNSSDYFLLLKLKNSGLGDIQVIGVYIFYNIIFAVASYPLGKLGDKIGFRNVMILGLVLFAAVYADMAVNDNVVVYLLLFLFYGIYAAATDGISKAWVTNLVPKNETATAVGTFTAFQSLTAMVASTLAGFIWMQFGYQSVFLLTSGVTIVVVLLIVVLFPKSKR